MKAKVGNNCRIPVEFGGNYMSKNMKVLHSEFSDLIDFFEKYGPTDIKDEKIPQIYLAQHSIEEINNLEDDIMLPTLCKTGKGQLYKKNIWLSGPIGATSPCHTDPFQNVLCQVFGEKTVILFHPNQEKYLYPAYHTVQKNTSLVDFDDIDDTRYPLLRSAVGYVAELHPGDGLFIPKKWWHHCQSLSMNCSVNFWWL